MLRRLVQIGVLLGVASCADLPDLSIGCGNLIVEQVSEDCDGAISLPKDVQGLACRPPSVTGACRFDCSNGGCPTGYACGPDQICRAPSGRFELSSSFAVDATHLLTGDFDGDERSDVLAYDDVSGNITVGFLVADGSLVKSMTWSTDRVVPVVGKVGETTRDDFIIGIETGLGVMRGQTGRTFAPTPYATITAERATDFRVVVTDAIPAPPYYTGDAGSEANKKEVARWAGDEVLAIVRGRLVTTDEATTDTVIMRTPETALPAGKIALGRFWEDLPCKALVLHYDDKAKVDVLSPCKVQDRETGWNHEDAIHQPTIPATTVTLPNDDVTITNVIVTQLNPADDEHADLLIVARGPSGIASKDFRAYAAYGLGDGHFIDQLSSMPPFTPNDKASLMIGLTLHGSPPLAVLDLNADGFVDLVDAHGIILNHGHGAATIAASAYGSWTEALIVDINDDGLPDVVAGSACLDDEGAGTTCPDTKIPDFKGDPDVDLLINAGGGVFNHARVKTEGSCSHFTAGDFDGDTHTDIAFCVHASGSSSGDTLQVIFGQTSGVAEQSVNLGQLGTIVDVVSGVDLLPTVPPNDISDIAVVSKSGDDAPPTVAGFRGRTDRLIQAPFFFPPIGWTRLLAATMGTFVSTGKPHQDVVAIAAKQGDLVDQLWVLSAYGEALFDAEKAKSYPLTDADIGEVDVERAVLGVVDADGDGLDELVVLAPSPTTGQTALLYVSFAAGAPVVRKTMLDELMSLDGQAGMAPGKPNPRGWDHPIASHNPPMCVGDVDGDHIQDIVMPTVLSDQGSRVAILWGTATSSELPPFDTSDKNAVVHDEAGTINGVACVNLDTDLQTEIVFVGDGGMFRAERMCRGSETCTHEDAGFSLEVGFLDETLDNTPAMAVAVGDVTGDAVPDLVVATSAGLLALRSIPTVDQ